MPVSMKKLIVNVKDGNEFKPYDLLYDNSKEQINDAKEAALTQIENEVDKAAQWATGGTSGTPSATNNAKYYAEQAQVLSAGTNFAPEFSTSVVYHTGQYVMKDGTLYQFIEDHAAGDWTGNDVVMSKLGPEVADLKSAITIQDDELKWNVSDNEKYIRISDGKSVDSSSGLGITIYVDVSGYKKIRFRRIASTSSNPSSGMAFYDSSAAYIVNSSIPALGNQASAGYVNELYEATVPATAKYARFTIQADITTYGEFRVVGLENIGDTVDELSRNIDETITEIAPISLCDAISPNWSTGYIAYDTGEVSSNDNYKVSAYINVEGISKIKYTRVASTSASSKCGIAFYNESFAYVDGQQGVTSATALSYVITDISVPNGAKYARFSKSMTLENNGTYFELYDADQYDAAMHSRITALEANVGALETELTIPFKSKSFLLVGSGFIRSNDGARGTGSGTTNYTSFVDIRSFKKIKYKRPKTNNSSSLAGMAFYSQNTVSSYIEGIKNVYDAENLGYEWNVVDVPNNAKYARFTTYADTDTYGEFEIYGQQDVNSAIEELQNQEIVTAPIVGSPVLHLTETDPVWAAFDGRPVANNGTPYTAVYDLYDALCTEYPHWIKRNEDLSDDSEGNPIAHYTVRMYDPIVGGDAWKNWNGSNPKPTNDWAVKTEYRRALLSAGVHGIEKSGVLALYFLVKDIVSSSESWANFIRSNFILEIVPIICPGNFNANRRENINNVNVNRDYIDKTSVEAQAITSLIDSFSSSLHCTLDFHMTHNNMGYLATPVSNPDFGFMMTLANQTSAACASNWDSVREAFNIGDQYFPYVFGDASENEGTQPDYMIKSGITNYAFTVEMPKADDMGDESKSANYVKLSKMGMDMGANLLQALMAR